MAINDALLTIGAQAMADAAVYAAIHTAEPNASGSNESAADRVLIDWNAAASGDVTLNTDLEFTGGTVPA